MTPKLKVGDTFVYTRKMNDKIPAGGQIIEVESPDKLSEFINKCRAALDRYNLIFKKNAR